jgi:hypothetical protein
MTRLPVRLPIFLLRQIAIVAAAIIVYFGVRGLTVGRPATAQDNASDILTLEKRLGLDHEATMQDLLVGREWLVDIGNWVYIWGHWPVIVTVMFWLAIWHRTHFLRLRNAMLISGGIGLFIYASYPVAPPRLAGLGLVDTVSERSQAYRVLQPAAFVNPYAAMPSLHVGWDLLVGLTVMSAAGTVALRTIGALMPVLMAVAVVLTANHFLLDGVAGAALALLGLAGALAIERRQERQRNRPAVHIPEPRTTTDEAVRAAYTDLAS